MSTPRKGPGRPPKYVKDARGREIVGLRLHAATGRYYDIDGEGKRVYFGKDFDAARSAHRKWRGSGASGRVTASTSTSAKATDKRTGTRGAETLRRQERLRESTRAEILQSSIDLLLRKDLRQISMRQIARAAGVGTGTLYNYFHNKDELLQELLSGVLADVSGRILAPLKSPGDALSRLKAFIENHYRTLVENAVPIQVFIRQLVTIADGSHDPATHPGQLRRLVAPHLGRTIEAGIDAGIFRPVNASLLALSLLSTLEVVASNSIFAQEPVDAERIIRDVQEFYLQGLLPRNDLNRTRPQ